MDEFVFHDRDHFKFYMEIDDQEAYLLYNVLPSGDLDFFKTYVPEALRGRKLAEKLMKAGIEYADKKNIRIKPSCSYVVGYFERNPSEVALAD